jgi:diguanylate cyclase (GGDEF)-like protein/PAS domain S-box-containing protein
LNKHPIQDRFKTQWVLLLTVLLAVSCVLAYTQLRMRESIIFDESVRLQTLTRVADQVLTVQVASADAALRTMRDGLDRWRSGDDYAPFAMEHLKRVEKMMPGARTFVVLNAQGRCQLSNRPELVGQMFNQRDYFVQAVASVATGEDVLTVSVPYRTALGVWAVTVSRAVVDNAGVITGVVAATLSPDYFQTLMTNMGHSPDMRISLIHGLGRMYVSSPVTERLMDTDFLQPGTFTKRHLDSGQVENVFEGVTVIQGGEQRLAAVRTVSMKDLGARNGFIAVASRSMDALQVEWRHENALMTGAMLVMVVLSAASLLLYQRWVGRLERRAQRVEAELVASHAKYEQLANTLPCVLFDYEQHASGQLTVHFVSPYAQQLLGFSAEELTADPRKILQHMFPEDVLALQQQHAHAYSLHQPYECTVRLLRPDSQTAWVQMSASPSAVADQPDATLWSGFVFDVTDRMQLETELRHMAFHDPLTGTHNRRSFMQTLTQEVHRVQRTGEVAALLMLDIDHFKRVNDTYGHDAGDDVLKHLVGVLQAGLRRLDMLARLGGEEFAVLLPATQMPGALELAERLRLAVEKNPAVLRDQMGQPGKTVAYTISIGVAVLDANAPSADDVLKRADHAMYQAKSTGRNRVCAEQSELDMAVTHPDG